MVAPNVELPVGVPDGGGSADDALQLLDPTRAVVVPRPGGGPPLAPPAVSTECGGLWAPAGRRGGDGRQDGHRRRPAWLAEHTLDPVARRGVGYVLACCAIPVGNATCLLTDHRILPLAWTRDGYFAARALLAWATATRSPEPARLVRRHLAWLFEVADRPEWSGRSRRSKAAGAALYATEETPADDPLHFPYQTACQLLAWYTLTRLDRLGVGGGRLVRLAQSVQDAVRRHQVLADSAPSRYAYATDLTGGKLDYHDANDLPMALAPVWGFCEPDDPVWRATMRFAFQPANPGFAPGPHGGLGSLHTPGSWPLGHIQNWLVGHATGQADAEAAAQQALEASALWDGALPEASDPRSGRPISRPWFAWPGATISTVLLDGLGTTVPPPPSQ